MVPLPAKNHETVSTLLKLHRENCGLFFPDTVYKLTYTLVLILLITAVFFLSLNQH